MGSSQPIEYIFLAGSVLLFLSILASKISGKFGIPALLIFLSVGMLAGSEGVGGIHFDDAGIAKSLGTIALAFILFSGGLNTNLAATRKVVWKGLSLSTFGVLITAVVVGYFSSWIFKIPLAEGFLLGAVVSSTDAAAVFSILRSRSIALKGQLKSLLEFESGSNDPMAVFLTIMLIQFIQSPGLSIGYFCLQFIQQLVLGLSVGFLTSRAIVYAINHLHLEYEGLYPVLTFALVLFTYGITTALGGNGFLAVYLLGLLLSAQTLQHKTSLMRFHEGLAWLMQIAMFLTLGLLVFPSQLLPVAIPGLIIAAVLSFLARPLAVFISLAFFKMELNEKVMLSWVGLRGAAPIVLATFPLLAGVPNAALIFNVVFFVVLISVLIQGTSIPFVAKWLNVNAPFIRKARFPIELEQREGVDAELLDYIVPFNGKSVGKAIYELNMPVDSLVVLVCRNEKFIIAKGSTVIEGGDVLLALITKRNANQVRKILSETKQENP